MLISHRHRFIFIHVPKNAGLSVEAALEPFADVAPRTQWRRLLSHLPVREKAQRASFNHHDTAAWVKRKLPPAVFDGYLKFAVSRNPYDRAVSYYNYLRQNEAHHRHARVKAMSFPDFLRYTGTREDTQVASIGDRDGRLLVDRVLRFESLSDDFAALCAGLGLEVPPLPKVNASKRGGYGDYFADEETRALAQLLYAPDFDALGYDIDPKKQKAVKPAKV